MKKSRLIMYNESIAVSPTLVWTDDFLLGHGGIDASHTEFVDQMVRLQGADDRALPDCFDGFVIHLRAHFEAENQLMLDTDFPPRQCHMDEHAAVLQSVLEVQQSLKSGRLNVVRDLICALAEWFPKHTQHLDSALAHWANKKRLGGKPVVIKRGLKLHA